MTNKQFAFKRESRLLTPKQYSNVFEQAIPAVSTHFTLLARKNYLCNARVGMTIPKKKVKLAVNRNRIKRCIRESFRLTAHRLPNIDIIIIAKHGINDLSNHEITQQLEKLWIKITKRCA